MKRAKLAIMKKGIPHCPYCRLPIESDLFDADLCQCRWCGELVRCLSASQHVEMIKYVDRKMLEEWRLEVVP